MAKKKETAETLDESVLVSAAKAIGTAAGKVAKLAGVAPEAREPAKSQKVPKLPKKDKHRLPRREKKALQKSSK
jgi:F420-0:gamma-glutamyl ligase